MQKAILCSLLLLWFGCNMASAQTGPRSTAAAKEPTSPDKRAAQVALEAKRRELRVLQAEIARLRRAAGAEPQKLSVHVEVCQAWRTKLDVAHGYAPGGGIANLLQHQKPASEVAAKTSKDVGDGEGDCVVFEPGSPALKLLDLWKQEGLVKTLAAPVFTVEDGESTSFNVGGEIPVMWPATQGAIHIEYRRYGTELGFTATLHDNGKVRLELRPRVRELDQARAIVKHGQRLPAARVRELDSVITLHPGQVAMLNGPTESKSENQQQAGGRRQGASRVQLVFLVSVELVDKPESADRD